MTRTELLSILQERTDEFKEQSRLRDDVLDVMEQAYIKGKNEQLNMLDFVDTFFCQHKLALDCKEQCHKCKQ